MTRLNNLVGRVRTSRRVPLFCAAFLGVCFVAASCFSSAAAGGAQTLAVIAYAYLVGKAFEREPDALLRTASCIFVSAFPFYIAEPLTNYTSLGVVLSPVMRKIADGLIALAIITLVIVLVLYAMQAFRKTGLTARSVWKSVAVLGDFFRQRTAAENRIANLRLPMPIVGAAAILTVVAVALSAVPGDSWRLIGSSSGGVWNAHVLGAPMERSGLRLADDMLVTSKGSPAYVAIPDSMALNAVKLLHPGTINGAVFWVDAATAGSIWLLLIGLTLFVEIWIPNRFLASLVAFVFTLLPFGMGLLSAAPFDVGLPLIVVALLVTGRWSTAVAASATLFAAFLNVSCGYEVAVLVLLLWAFGYISNSKTALIVTLSGAVGSILFANLVAAMAPQVSLREAWWNAGHMGHSFATELTLRAVIAIAVVTIVAVAGLYQMVRVRQMNLVFLIITLSAVAAVLALPAHLQGVVFIVPATLLDKLSPMGWPSGRFLCIMVLVATAVPTAFALARFLQMFSNAQYALQIARGFSMVAVAILFFAMLPRQAPNAVPRLESGVRTVILPLGERGSAASVLEANALLEDGALILQPIPYFDSSRISYEGLSNSATLVEISRAHAREVVVMYSLYKEPSLVTASPQLYSLRDYLEPRMSANPRFTIQKIWPEVEVYRVN